MINSETATSVAEGFRLASGWHPFLLALQVIVHAGETGTWGPKSKAALKRSLRRPKDDTELSDKDLDAVIRHAAAMGLLSAESTLERLVLAGSKAQAEDEEVAA